MRQSTGFTVDYNNLNNSNMMIFPSDIADQMLNSKIRSSCLSIVDTLGFLSIGNGTEWESPICHVGAAHAVEFDGLGQMALNQGRLEGGRPPPVQRFSKEPSR